MNNPIIKDLQRMKELFGITEQTQQQSVESIINSKDTTQIKQFLIDNPNLQKKLQELFASPTLDDLTTRLINPNNTIVMRGLQRSSMSCDMEMYEFLDILSKIKN